jgi:hypothetical protein
MAALFGVDERTKKRKKKKRPTNFQKNNRNKSF